MSDPFGPNSGNNWNGSASGPFGQRPDADGTRRVDTRGAGNNSQTPPMPPNQGFPPMPSNSPKSSSSPSPFASSGSGTAGSLGNTATTLGSLGGNSGSLPGAKRPKSKRNVAIIAALIVGVACLAVVLIMIAVDQLSTPNVTLPSTMPVAPEVQEWNKAVQDYVPTTEHPTAVDPVSKELVDPKRTPYKIDVYGTWFYFASEANLKAFTDDPLKYLKLNVNVQLLDDDGNPISPEDAANAVGAEEGMGSGAGDNADLYKMVPAPQGGSEGSASSGATGHGSTSGSAVPDASSGNFEVPADLAPPQQGTDMVPGSAVHAVPQAGGQAVGAPPDNGSSSMYQQVPPPASGAPSFQGGQAPQGNANYQGDQGYPSAQGGQGYPSGQGNPSMQGGQGYPGAPSNPSMQGGQGYQGGQVDPNMQGSQGYPGGQGAPGGWDTSGNGMAPNGQSGQMDPGTTGGMGQVPNQGGY